MWIFGYGSLVWKVDFPIQKKLIGYVRGYERRFFQASIDHRGVPEKPGRVVTLLKSADPEAKVWGAAYKIGENDVADVIEHLDLREVMGYEKVPIEFFPLPNHPLNIDYKTEFKSACQSVVVPNGKVSEIKNDCNKRQSAVLTDCKSNRNECKENKHHTEGVNPSMGSHDVGVSFNVTMYYGSHENEHFIGGAALEEMANQIFYSVGPSGTNKDYLFRLADAMRQISDEAIDEHLAELEKAVLQIEKHIR